MSKYVRVMDGLKSNASGEEFKLDEVITANVWNPTETEPEEVCSTFIPSEDECRIATRILDCYRHVLQPKRHTLVRYLVIAKRNLQSKQDYSNKSKNNN